MRGLPALADAEEAARIGRGRLSVVQLVDTLDRWLRRVIEIPLAVLLVVEIVVLSAGVVARYVFHSPLIWSDELANMLFLWLSMLGATSAFRRFEHMRMTAFIRAGTGRGKFLDILAIVAGVMFLGATLHPAYEFASDEAFVTMPALSISNAWRAAALPVGIALMLMVGCLQLLRAGLRPVLRPSLVALVAVIALTLFSPLFRELGNLNLVIFFVVAFASLVFAGVPIAFAFGLSTIGYLTFTTSIPNEVIVGRMNEGMAHPILLSVPLFIFLGLLIQATGMAAAMVNFLASLVGHVRGGLLYVLIGSMYLVSGISGSKAADMAAVAPVLFPEMRKRGAEPGRLVALLSAAGAQTETIPPSLVLIAVGSVTNVSIAALFTGGLLPGAILGVVLCLIVWWQARSEGESRSARAPVAVMIKCLFAALPALLLPFVIRSAVIEGIATATEVSTIGIVYTLIVGVLFFRKLDWTRMVPMLVDTATLSGAVLFVIGAASGMAWALTQSGFSALLASAMTALPGGQPSFLIVSVAAFVILGTVLEGIPAMVLFGPLLFPVARAMGIHEVHYAIVVILAMGIGLFAPPFGVGYYMACAIGNVNPDAGMKPILPYLAALFLALLILALLPWVSVGFL
ncbi:TRAP transporter large permease subunit [Bradyrhizobium sp.]|uniref:TRAP transporter large permease n=1 Tax=Bradyrhizobium sp. TaxID=376 RepID=UPI0039B92FC3